MYCKTALALLFAAAISCSRPSSVAVQRLAVLRFENLSGDPSRDWMGRGFSEIVSRDLAGAPGIYAIPPSRLHSLDAALGKRAAGAPGISAERALAIASGADWLAYGEYWLRNGGLEARLTLEDLGTGKMRVFSVSAAGVAAAADALANQVSGQAERFATSNSNAIEGYVLALEDADPRAAADRLSESIAAAPDFGLPYAMLAQLKLQQRDPSGAAAVLDQALSHRDRIRPLERVQLEFEAAGLRGDVAARQKALADWQRLTPNDPVVWRSSAELAMNRHFYAQSAAAYRRALAVEPGDPALLNQFAYAAAYAGDLPEATRALERYAALRPADPNALDSLGDINVLAGRLGPAENFYLQAAKKSAAFLGGGDFRKAAMARLMTGDVRGATELFKQYLDRRAAARDPLVDYYEAEWLWTTGSRKEACERLEAFARKTGAAEAYGELAIWKVALGDRRAAQEFAAKAESGNIAAIARFVAQAPASPEEWEERAGRAFPEPAQEQFKELALAYALLTDRQFAAALRILKPMYDSGRPAAADDPLPVLLAWSDLETGRTKEAAELLRVNPLPSSAGVRPFLVFYFPRLFYLRGEIARLAGDSNTARAQFRLFLQLSGDTPLLWQEEARAH